MPVIQEPEPWGQATRQTQLPLETTAEKWIKSTEEEEGVSRGKNEKQTEQMFFFLFFLRGGGGSVVMGGVRGQWLYGGGRRGTVSAGLELARFRAGPQTAARNQTRTTHSRRERTHTSTHRQAERAGSKQAQGAAGAHTQTHKERAGEGGVCAHTQPHICRVRAGLCARAEAWGVWRVFGGINGLQMSGTRWREGSARSFSPALPPLRAFKILRRLFGGQRLHLFFFLSLSLLVFSRFQVK